MSGGGQDPLARLLVLTAAASRVAALSMTAPPAASTLALDTIHQYRGYTGCRSRCRLRFYRPAGLPPVVIATELDDNPGTSITNCAEQLAAEVLRDYLPERVEALRPLIWIEHYGPSRALRLPDRYSEVRFETWRPKMERVFWGDGPRLRLGRPTWSAMSRAAVEALIGERLPEERSAR